MTGLINTHLRALRSGVNKIMSLFTDPSGHRESYDAFTYFNTF